MSYLKEKIKTSLWEKFSYMTGETISKNGYVKNIEDNLVPGISTNLFLNDLKQGSGNELESKFKAVHSSSALAVNVFAFWKKYPNLLSFMDNHGFDSITFEKKCPTILGGSPPNLDIFLENDSCVVGIESKFLEYLTPKVPSFAKSYSNKEFPNAEKCWLSLIESLPENGKQFLDAAQLVKHYLGLINNYHSKEIFLVYLFWEPDNWNDHDIFIQHRHEIEKFKKSVLNSVVRFKAISYQELWLEWEGHKNFRAYVKNLKRRYCLEISAPEIS